MSFVFLSANVLFLFLLFLFLFFVLARENNTDVKAASKVDDNDDNDDDDDNDSSNVGVRSAITAPHNFVATVAADHIDDDGCGTNGCLVARAKTLST